MGAILHRRGARARAAVDVTGDQPKAAPAPDPVEPRAWRSRRAWIVLLTIIVASLVADLATKSIAFSNVAGQPVVLTRAEVLANSPGHLDALIPAHQPVRAVPGLLDLTLVLNPGAVFGIGAGKRWVFVGFTAVALAFGLWIFGAKTRPDQRLPHVAIGLLIGGGLGNLYDRLRYACVRDFLHPLPDSLLPFGIRWPNGSREIWPYVSNVADLLLIIGIALLMWHIWRSDRPTDDNDDEPTDDAAPADT